MSKMKFLLVLLIVPLTVLILFQGSAAHAATSGYGEKSLLYGKSLNLTTGGTTSALTDGSQSTFIYTAQRGFWLTFNEPIYIDQVWIHMNLGATSLKLTFKGGTTETINITGGSGSSLSKTYNVKNKTKELIRFDFNQSTTSGGQLYEFDMRTTEYYQIMPPTGFTGVTGNNQANLSWDANYDPEIAGYNIYRDGIKVNSSLILGTSYIDTGLINGNSYEYTVTAVDTSDNESVKSSPVTVTPEYIPPDEIPPLTPIGLDGIAGNTQVILSWNANNEADLAGYNIYRQGIKVNSSLIVVTSYIDKGLINGNSYEYTVTAVDTSNNESLQSSSVTVTPEAPPPPPLNASFIGNKNSIVVLITGGTPPYRVTSINGTETFSASSYTITGLEPNTVYTVTVEDDDGATITQEVNTGNIEAFIPPTLPNPVEIFQRMIDSFGIAGTIAIAIIGGAVILGVMVILGIWGWRLLKKWLRTAK